MQVPTKPVFNDGLPRMHPGRVIMALGKLYTLEIASIVGYVGETHPDTRRCPVCGGIANHYREIELVLDMWPECDLIAATTGEYFASERLLAELEAIGATGYSHWPATLSLDEQLRSPQLENGAELPRYRHLVITGRCDGPWLDFVKGAACAACGQPAARPIDSDGLMRRILDGRLPSARLVYTDSWHSEDFFELPEPGLTVITERVARILCRTGNLRKRAVVDRAEVRRLMPRFADRLEKAGWEQPVCASLGPASWVTRSEP